MISAITNHLWQSTMFVFAAWLVAAALRRNRAAIRYGVWLSASLKFLVPLAWLLSLGHALPRVSPVVSDALSSTATAGPALPVAVNRLTEPFSTDVFEPSPLAADAHTRNRMAAVLGAIWLAGIVSVLSKRLRDWGRVTSALRASHPVALGTAIPVRVAPALLEPGVVGIRRPVLLVPAGLEEHLTSAQLRAVLEHELSHVRRRDNLTSALHMVVESIFWFHPLVWWIGARLIQERECACDEHVLRVCGEPRAYAEGILRVCQHYVESPLACVSGVTGADLKRRVSSIMNNRVGLPLNGARKCGLMVAAVLAVLLPVVAGMLSAPLRASAADLARNVLEVQDTSTPARFEVVSIKPCGGAPITGGGGAGGATGARSAGSGQTQISPGYAHWDCATLAQLIDQAYADLDHPLVNTTAHLRPTSLQAKHVRGGPSWVEHDTYTIEAKGAVDLAGDTRPGMTLPGRLAEAVRAMLEDRFHLSVHRATEARDIYALRLGKTGLDTQRVTHPIPGDCFTLADFSAGGRGSPPRETKICGHPYTTLDRGTQYSGMAMSQLAIDLAPLLDQFVRDETGITGTFNFWLDLPRWPAPSDDQVIAAVRQLGLTLEPTKGQGEYIVIDRVERPTPNTPHPGSR